MGDYTLTWVEQDQQNTIYFRASEGAATVLAAALASDPSTYNDVSLTRQETVPHEVSFKGKKS